MTTQTRNLLDISSDLEKLNELLDEMGDDVEQQQLISQWFDALDEERDRKLDNYAALIGELSARAEVRRAEARRLMALAQSDENRAKFLKERLKWFFETHNLKKVETPRFRLSLVRNSLSPLLIDNTIQPTELPEQYQKITVEVDTATIREALNQGEQLSFAQFGEVGQHIRIG